ncbi:MAG: hypothetical protein AB1673_08865 [Actinomycetota bacterium]
MRARVVSALLATAVWVGTVLDAPPSGALPIDPLDLPELPFEFFEAPPDGFAWQVPSNFGPTRNGIVDYRWNEEAGSRFDGPAYTYDPAYVRPASRTAYFDGCPTKAEAEAPGTTTYVYTWSVHDPVTGAAMGAGHSARSCEWSRSFDLDPVTGRSAPVTVRLTITTTEGAPYPGYPSGKTFDEQLVEVRDILVVSLGDSYGSGEGAPDAPQVIDGLGFVASPARWVDKRCHRSANAPSAVAARQLEAADPHSTVTFLSFACSGATISTPYFGDQAKLDPYRAAPAGGFEKPVGTGVLGPYRGVDPPDPDDWSDAGKLPSQVDQLRRALTNGDPGTTARHIDALTISAGGNDMGFGPVALVCTLYYECQDHFVSGALGEGPVRLSHRFGQSVATMAARYAALGAALSDLEIGHTYVTQYPDPSRTTGGALCPKILDDVIPVWMAPLLAPIAVIESQPAPLPPYQIDGGDRPGGGEVGWAGSAVLAAMNGAVASGAAANGWTLVDGIADGTANLFSGHGYCAPDNWIRTATESVAMQGPWDPPAVCNVGLMVLNPIVFLAACAPPATTETTGTLHPTARGYQAIAGRLMAKMRPDLLPAPPAGDPPGPAFSEARAGALVGDDGWLTGNAGPGPCAGGAPACAPVTVTASVPATTSLLGVSVAVNGSPLACPAAGATTGAVTCRSELTGTQTNVWSLSFGADGIYQVETTATARNGTRSESAFQYKVDLNDPTAASATATSSVPATGGWYRVPVDVLLAGQDAPGGSGIGGLEYRVNGGPPQTVPDGTTVTFDSDGEHLLVVRPVDRAGRRGAEAPPLMVRIDRQAPTIGCGEPDGVWHAADVGVACTAIDGGSGLVTPGDGSFTLMTAVPEGTETAEAATGSRAVCDVAGNCATAGPVGGHRVDRRAPDVMISAPVPGRYVVNQVVTAAYSCTDGGSGVAACEGPVPPGAALDTSTVGQAELVVHAADHTGNRSQGAVSYSVGYATCLLYDADRPRQAGSAVVVTVQLCDAAGSNLSSSQLRPEVVGVVEVATGAVVPLRSPGRSNPESSFRFEDGAYSFTLSTSGYRPGRYELRFTVAGDAGVHAAPFTVR